MSSNPNVLLRIFENSKPETCDEIEPDSDKRFYTQGQVRQIQEAVELYVERKKILEDNIGNSSITVKDLDGIIIDLGDSNDPTTRENFIPNRIANNEDEVTIKDELIGMKETYEKNHKKFEKEYDDFFQKKLNKARKNNPFTVAIGSADVLRIKFKDMERRNNEYKNTEEPFKSLLECASFVENREELLQKLFKLFTGVAALDDAATRKKFPMNFWDPSVIAADVIQNIEKDIKKREKAIEKYKEVYEDKYEETFTGELGEALPPPQNIFQYETTNVKNMTQRIIVLANKRQQTQVSIEEAKEKYRKAFLTSSDDVKKQIDGLNNEQDINKARRYRKDLRNQLDMIRSNPAYVEKYKDMLDGALNDILQKRKKLLEKYEKTFNFKIKTNDNRGLYQTSDNDIQTKIDKRNKLLKEAENYYTPKNLDKINNEQARNTNFKNIIKKRKEIVEDLKKYHAYVDNSDWKKLDNPPLKKLVEKRMVEVENLENTFESRTNQLLKESISTLKVDELKNLANERQQLLTKLESSYNGEDLPFDYKSKALVDIREMIQNRVKQYNKVAEKVKELSGEGETDALSNKPNLKVLKNKLKELQEKRIILEARLSNLDTSLKQQWNNEQDKTNKNLEKFIETGSATSDLVKEIESIDGKINNIDNSISALIITTSIGSDNIANIRKNINKEMDKFNFEKKKFAELQKSIERIETSLSDTVKNQIKNKMNSVKTDIQEVDGKIKNLDLTIKNKEKSRREIDEIAPVKDILSFKPNNINTDTVKDILDDEIDKSKNNDNENGSLKDTVLNKDGFNVEGDILSKGYWPVRWLQTFTNIDDTDNTRLRFINRYDGHKVLGYASNEAALFYGPKSGFAWSERDKNGSSFWVNGWCRITINRNKNEAIDEILDKFGFKDIEPNQTLYINLENRTEILARTEFLEKLKNNLEKFGDYERRSVNKNVEYNVKVQNWFDNTNFAKVPLDEVEHIDFSGSKPNPIKYLIAPSREEFINSIRKAYEKRFGNNEYPDLESRGKIQDLFNVLFLKADDMDSGVSWNGQATNAVDLTDDSLWAKKNFTSNLRRKENTQASESDINNAFWKQIKFQLVDGGSPRILVHRISKYKKLQRESDKPEKSETEFYIECISDGGEGYCLKYDTTVAENISSFFDEEKKLFIFKDEDDVKRRNSTALATSSLVNEELLDTDDESVQTFRFVPNI